uniref:HSF-type DNA-binding domain-containing protein n=1 Tax=Grammatophora oceanica TaxID=210454 RepID=A0A7S1UYS0_9STRA|mmetsp:Transcript_29835/g.44036  ORF Transcript_29835/g.44036 Transcript_29835/m.44036 type:complete len:440 (+) Transcript_29835:34-1353(+)
MLIHLISSQVRPSIQIHQPTRIQKLSAMNEINNDGRSDQTGYNPQDDITAKLAGALANRGDFSAATSAAGNALQDGTAFSALRHSNQSLIQNALIAEVAKQNQDLLSAALFRAGNYSDVGSASAGGVGAGVGNGLQLGGVLPGMGNLGQAVGGLGSSNVRSSALDSLLLGSMGSMGSMGGAGDLGARSLLMQNALQTQKDAAMLSLLSGNAGSTLGPTSLLGPSLGTALPAAASAGIMPQSEAMASARGTTKEVNDKTLEALGTQCLDRRTKNAPYFDASTLEDPDPIALANRRTRGGVTEPFPEKLHRMLRDAEKNGQTDIICWFPHGRAFAIKSTGRFVAEIMPKYFKQSRLSSFQRQLNLYGFTRINSGPDAGGYYHELFLAKRPALCVHIKRVGVPQATPRRRGVKAHDATKTPDFYSMPKVRAEAGAATRDFFG